MAEPATLPATLDFEDSAEPTNKVDDGLVASSLSEFLRSYTPSEQPAVKDILNGRYKIHPTSPLPEYDTKTARAFSCSDVMDASKKLIALVCRPNTAQRHHAIQMLLGYEHPNILTLHAAGAVSISQPDEERFVLIYSRPQGKKLSELVAALTSPLNDGFISKNIMAPVIAAIGQFADLGIAHGSIRPDNIFYGDYPVLGDCLTEPCGYSQPFYFDTLDRMQTPPSAKGEGNISQDYYALAILALYLLYGEKHFTGYTKEALTIRILKDGAYSALLLNREPPENFNDFLRGLLSGNVNERWNHRNLKQWIEGKRSNIMLPASPSEALRPFEYGNIRGSTKRELAHAFFRNWDQTRELMGTDQLIQWVIVSLRNKELAESLKRIKRNISEANAKNEIQVSEQLMRMLLLFDPNGPIRINNLAFNFDGLDTLVVELINNKSQNELQLLTRFIELSMSSHWLDIQRSTTDYIMPKPVNNVAMKIDRLRLFIRNTGYGFGAERMLYELNPEMPCQSPLFANLYINNLPSLLKHLDRLAPKLHKEMDPIDNHIAAFIANRLGILHEIKLPELIPHPSLATNKSVLALRLISMAQDRNSNLQLPGLAHWLAFRTLPALDVIRSRTLRRRIKEHLLERAKSGYSQLLAQVIVHSNYAIADVSGLGRAAATYSNNIERIAYYKTEAVIHRQSARLGVAIAKFIACLMFLFVLYQSWGIK